MPAESALRLPCRHRHGNGLLIVAAIACGCGTKGVAPTPQGTVLQQYLPADQLDRALQAHAAADRARRINIATGGRPAESWHASIPHLNPPGACGGAGMKRGVARWLRNASEIGTDDAGTHDHSSIRYFVHHPRRQTQRRAHQQPRCQTTGCLRQTTGCLRGSGGSRPTSSVPTTLSPMAQTRQTLLGLRLDAVPGDSPGCGQDLFGEPADSLEVIGQTAGRRRRTWKVVLEDAGAQ
jgi:hypothetical protein